MPVFRVEDTEGKELDYQETLRAFDPSKFPLYQVAVSLGVKVSAGLTTNAYGFFSPDENQIVLGTDDVTTFMHELSHAIDNSIPGSPRTGLSTRSWRSFPLASSALSTISRTTSSTPRHTHFEDWKGRSSVAIQVMKAVRDSCFPDLRFRSRSRRRTRADEAGLTARLERGEAKASPKPGERGETSPSPPWRFTMDAEEHSTTTKSSGT